MTPRRRVRFTPEAAIHVAEIHDWWSEHRTAARGLFGRELAAAADLLARAPLAGQAHPSAALPDVRRLYLRKTRFHVYYQAGGDEVVIVAVWSALREHGPPLGDPP